MGVYDSVMVPCPRCGRSSEFQSKSGQCTLELYELDDCPQDVLADINRHSPHACDYKDCDSIFEVRFEDVLVQCVEKQPMAIAVSGPAWPDNEGARHYIPLPSVDGDAA